MLNNCPHGHVWRDSIFLHQKQHNTLNKESWKFCLRGVGRKMHDSKVLDGIGTNHIRVFGKFGNKVARMKEM